LIVIDCLIAQKIYINKFFILFVKTVKRYIVTFFEIHLKIFSKV